MKPVYNSPGQLSVTEFNERRKGSHEQCNDFCVFIVYPAIIARIVVIT